LSDPTLGCQRAAVPCWLGAGIDKRRAVDLVGSVSQPKDETVAVPYLYIEFFC